MVERLDVADVGILQVRVLTDEGDRDLALRVLQSLQVRPPFLQVLPFGVQVEPLQDVVREPLSLEDQRDVVDRRRVRGADHALHGDVAEERDLLLDLRLQAPLPARDDHARLDAHRPELPHALLRGLRLLLPDGPHDRHEGRVDEQDVLLPFLERELPEGLDERHPFDVADGSADLDQDDIGPLLLANRADHPFDLVRDMGDDLDRLPEVVPAPLFLDHGAVHLPRRDVVVSREVHVEEPLVVPEIEVRLRSVVEDEDLPVLVGVHRARVHVQVRIDLHGADPQAAGFQKDTDRTRGDALP